MITRLQATGFRCLRDVDQPLQSFQLLVGANGSGKTAFLDAFRFLATLLVKGVRAAVEERSRNFHDLVWGREGTTFSLRLEALCPESLDSQVPDFREWPLITYEIRVRIDTQQENILLEFERICLRKNEEHQPAEREVARRDGASVKFKSEVQPSPSAGEFPPSQPLLSIMDQTRFPRSAWLKDRITAIKLVHLEPKDLASPSPPFIPDRNLNLNSGWHLPRSVSALQDRFPDRFDLWLVHMRTVLPDVESIKTVARPEDKHRYVMVKYSNGVEVPSWCLSDGTLRLLALTILAYLPNEDTLLIEEPENGLHPTAIEAVYQSLSSVYEGQVLIATHEPMLVSLAKPSDLLCFTKTEKGTTITRGDQHAALLDWQHEVTLGEYFAAGVLN